MGWCKAVWKLGGWKPWEFGFVVSIANLCTLPITFTILEPKFCSIGCHMIQMVAFPERGCIMDVCIGERWGEMGAKEELPVK